MKNKLSDLNDHLFAQIERLSDEKLTPEKIETEIQRGAAIVAVTEQILRCVDLQVRSAKIVSDHGMDPTRLIPQFGPEQHHLIEGPKQ